jgi:ubiquinone/menaquinone biosynthesis C-methylase UbiE
MSADMTTIQGRITAFWDAVAGDYDCEPGNVPAADTSAYVAWVDAVRSVLPRPPSDVVDVGTGTGFVARIAAEAGHRVTGMDLSEKMLAVAQRNADDMKLDVNFVSGDAVAPPLPAASFDAIVTRNLIWTLREPEAAFSAWHALLRSGGRVAAIYSLPTDQERDDPSAEQPPDDGHRAFFTGYYTPQTRAALPGMKLGSHEPLLHAVRQAGFIDPVATPLQIGATAPDATPASYALIAYRR